MGLAKLKDFASNDLVLLGIRLAIGFLFLYACVDKILYPDQFAVAIKNYLLLPLWSVNFWAITLPWMELFTGLLLVLGVWSRSANLLAGLMFLSFFIALALAVSKGLDISCGCFHQDGTGGDIGPWYLLRDGLLIASTLPGIIFGGGRFALDNKLTKSS